MKFTASETSHWYFLDEDEISAQTGIEGHFVKTALFELKPDGLLILYKNFCWNGSSFVQDTPACMRASAFHDALCLMMVDNTLPEIYRKEADALYYKLCRDDGMGWIQAKVRLAGLKLYRNLVRIG